MHYIITLFNLIYPTLLQLQITIKLKTFRISLFTKKKYIFKAQRAKFQVFFSRDKESVYSMERRRKEHSPVPETAWLACRLQIAAGYTPLFHPPRPLRWLRRGNDHPRGDESEREKEREKGESKNTWRTVFFTLLVRGFTSSSSRMDGYSAGKSPLCPKVKYLPFPARDSHILARVSYLTHGRLLFLSLSLGEEDSRSLALFSPRNYVVRDSLSTRISTELFHGRWSVVRKEGKEEHVERCVSL